jgi:multidrug efflux pump subunit AcrB
MAKRSLSDSSREAFFELSRLAIAHPWLTICTWIAIAVAGMFAFSSLQYALFPDFTFPVVVVNASAPIETVLETESALTDPLEAQFIGATGINNVLSTTLPGQTLVTLRYQIGTDLDQATATVEEAVATLDLPADSNLEVIPLNLNEEVAVSYALIGSGTNDSDLADLAEAEILPVIEAIPGVLRVDLLGTGAQTAAATPTAGEAAEPATTSLPTLVRFNGEDALAFQVVKQAEANTLEVVQQVEETVAQLREEFPDIQLELATTQATFIREATQATIDALWQAIVLAILVIFAFLRDWRATLITALAIPLSLLATCIVMAVAGFNLETITLLALALVIGIVVDDAIVEVENIVRHMEAGESPRQAAINASREISLTVSVSTLTIVAVFLPVAFMSGTVGQFFKPFGLTVSAAVVASLLIARTLTPVLAIIWLRQAAPVSPEYAGKAHHLRENSVLLEIDVAEMSGVTQQYAKLLNWSLHHRWIVVGIAIATFAVGVSLIPMIPTGFIPKLDRGEFNISFTTALPQQMAVASEVQSELDAFTDLPTAEAAQPVPDLQPQTALNDPAMAVNPLQIILDDSRQVAVEFEETALANAKVASVFSIIGIRGAPNQGRLYVQLSDDRDLSTAEVQDEMRATLPDVPDVTTSVEDIPFVETGGEKPLEVILTSEDLDTLYQASQDLQEQVADLPEFVDVTVTGVDRDGDTLTAIERRNGQRVAYLRANLSEGQALGDATNQVVELAEATLPESVSLGLGADSARIEEVLGGFLQTLGFSVLCMMVVLFLPFGRLLEPLVVGLSLPLAIVGAMVGFLITQSAFGMASVIGLLFLLGLLDKNALLLMDYTNQLRSAGLSRLDALMKTGPVRFRPILMTTASTILGMMPIALGWGAGAELRQPMAVAIIGGLMTSTLLSLVVVPVLYTLLEDGWDGMVKRVKGVDAERRP